MGDTPRWVKLTDATSYPDQICIATNKSGVCIQYGHTIGLLDGKYSNTTWDFDACGYYWGDECQKRIGFVIDKQVALDILSQSQAYFTGRDTSTDVRTYAIGYVLPFKAQLEDKLGALFSADLSGYAPYYTKNPDDTYSIVQPSWVLPNPLASKASMTSSDPMMGLVDPSAGFTLSLYAGVYALSAFPSTFDHDFIDNTRIFVVGNGEAPISDSILLDSNNPVHTSNPNNLISHKDTNPSASAEWFVITDPINGQKYGAHASLAKSLKVVDATGPDGESVVNSKLRSDIGVRMLEQLLNYGNAYADALSRDPTGQSAEVSFTKKQYDNFRQNIEIMRSLHSTFGYGPYSTSPSGYY